MQIFLRSWLVALAVILAACSPGNVRPVLPAEQSEASQTLPAAKGNDNLYVANLSSVTVYGPAGTSVLRQISKVSPVAISINAAGQLFVANYNAGVAVYAAGTSKVVRTITQSVVEEDALAFDAASDLYVANYYHDVTMYRPRASKPSKKLHVFFCVAMAFDSSGYLYAANNSGPYGGSGGSIYVFDRSGERIRKITDGVGDPSAVAFDGSGNLYVANLTSVDRIGVYAPGATTRLRTIAKGVSGPNALAFDTSGNLYVANGESSSVTVYAPGAALPMKTLRNHVSHPRALRFDAKGDLFVANAKSITEYAPKTLALMRTITQGVNTPVALAFGP